MGCVWPLAFPDGTSQLLTQLWFNFSQTDCLGMEGPWGLILQVLLPKPLTLAWELVLWLAKFILSQERDCWVSCTPFYLDSTQRCCHSLITAWGTPGPQPVYT